MCTHSALQELLAILCYAPSSLSPKAETWRVNVLIMFPCVYPAGTTMLVEYQCTTTAAEVMALALQRCFTVSLAVRFTP